MTTVSGHYILDAEGNPVPVADVHEWVRWFETAERHVANDRVGRFLVSTVFLGVDHAFHGGPPVLWETIIFGAEGDELNQEQWRYRSREEALEGHRRALALVVARAGN